MKPSLKSVIATLFAAFAALTSLSPAPSLRAEDVQGAAESANPAAREELARSVIARVLEASGAARIYAEFRQCLSNLYLPLLRDAIEGTLPGAPPLDARAASRMATLYTFLDYVRRASDQLDGPLADNREAMISDAARILADNSATAELEDLSAVLRLPAAQKAFDALHALTRVVTGASYEDARSFTQFSAWAKTLDLDITALIPGLPRNQPPPSPEKVAKAQALVADLLAASHLDEMVERVKRFARDVYAETAPLTEEERQALKTQIDQYEFAYNLQKSVTMAAAPSLIAASLTDEQLATVQAFVSSGAFARAFGRLSDAVRAATAFTREDVLSSESLIEDLDRRSRFDQADASKKEKIDAAWDAYFEKWKGILADRLSPEVRAGLEDSWEKLNATGNPT